MVCDKCKKHSTDSWIAGKSYPKYEITESTGCGEYFPIHLCYECSRKFSRWLDAKEGNRNEA